MATQHQDPLVNELEAQVRRLNAIRERRAIAQVKLDALKKTLEESKARAVMEFGTDDLGQLAALYKEKQAKNAKAVADFKSALDEVESGLVDIEKKLNG
jgi:hypothetical protein